MKQEQSSLEAERLWHNCVHKHIGSFTMSQEKQAIKDIELFLVKYKTETLADLKEDFKKKFISFFNEECKSCEGYLGQGEIMWKEFEEL